MKQAGNAGTVEIDLHGMNRYQARIALDAVLRRCGSGVYRVRVIHGYHGGEALRQLAEEYASHPRVLRAVRSADGGQTELVLRELTDG